MISSSSWLSSCHHIIIIIRVRDWCLGLSGLGEDRGTSSSSSSSHHLLISFSLWIEIHRGMIIMMMMRYGV